MLEAVISTLITICIVALIIYLILWVLESVGIALPPKVVQILWVIAVLVCILVIARLLLPALHIRF